MNTIPHSNFFPKNWHDQSSVEDYPEAAGSIQKTIMLTNLRELKIQEQKNYDHDTIFF
jgi:hypothetical protein